MSDLITIICPVYMVEDYLDRCVDSIVKQTYQNLEILLVVGDGGDKSLAMSYEWEKKDSRIKVIERPCNGLSDARNAGLDVMTGAYVAFIDSDDWLDEQYIEKLYNAIIDQQADSAVCGVRFLDEHDKLLEELPVVDNVNGETEVYPGREIVLRELRGKWQYVTAWGTLFPASFFKEMRYPFKRRNEDEFTFHHIYDGQVRVACLPDNMYNYLQRSDSLMGAGYSKKDCVDYMDMWEDRIAFYSEGERLELLTPVIQSFLEWSWLYMAKHSQDMGEEKERLVSLMKKYKSYAGKKPYLYDFKSSMKLRVKLHMALTNPEKLGQRYQ